MRRFAIVVETVEFFAGKLGALPAVSHTAFHGTDTQGAIPEEFGLVSAALAILVFLVVAADLAIDAAK